MILNGRLRMAINQHLLNQTGYVSKQSQCVLGLVLKLVPCLMLTIFMTLLVRMLIEARERRTRLCRGQTSGKSQAERTTTMLTAIVAVFLVTELPQGILVFAIGKLFMLSLHDCKEILKKRFNWPLLETVHFLQFLPSLLLINFRFKTRYSICDAISR